MKPKPTKHDPAVAVDTFNAHVPIGSEVEVRLDDGTTRRTRTRSGAFVLGGHTAVVMLEGITGGYLLERVTPTEAPKPRAPKGMPPILACLLLGLGAGNAACGGAPFTMGWTFDGGGGGGDPTLDVAVGADDAGKDGAPESSAVQARPDARPQARDGGAEADAEPAPDADAAPQGRDAGELEAAPPPADAAPPPADAAPPPALCCRMACASAPAHCATQTCYCGATATTCAAADLGTACWLVGGCAATGVLEVCP